MRSAVRFAITLVLLVGICTGCQDTQTAAFSVAAFAVFPESKTVVFLFGAPTDHEALFVKNVKEDVVLDLASYLSTYGKSITNARTWVELHDVKFLLSPQHTGKTYHVSIIFDRPLSPGEIGRGFSLDGGYDSVSFANGDEARELFSRGAAVRLDAVPHELHFVSKKVRSPGSYQSGP
jgi:hypothetical protein